MGAAAVRKGGAACPLQLNCERQAGLAAAGGCARLLARAPPAPRPPPLRSRWHARVPDDRWGWRHGRSRGPPPQVRTAVNPGDLGAPGLGPLQTRGVEAGRAARPAGARRAPHHPGTRCIGADRGAPDGWCGLPPVGPPPVQHEQMGRPCQVTAAPPPARLTRGKREVAWHRRRPASSGRPDAQKWCPNGPVWQWRGGGGHQLGGPGHCLGQGGPARTGTADQSGMTRCKTEASPACNTAQAAGAAARGRSPRRFDEL